MRKKVPILSVLKSKTAPRFLKKLVPQGDCLIFTGGKNKHGYGFVDVSYNYGERRYAILTHRLAWALHAGEDPPADKMVCHRCNNPSCCNWEHLYVGTARDNSNDRVDFGTVRRGKDHPLYGVRGPAHPRAKYDQATRDKAIKMMAERWNFVRLSKELGISRDTLSKWWREYEAKCGRRKCL